MTDSERIWEQTPLELSAESESFFSKATGLTGSDLRDHLEQVQKDALAICPYRCIAYWNFLDFRTASLPAYQDALALRSRPDALWLDVGCCTGTDVRKAISDGWPANRILGTDLESGFITIGRHLFKEPPGTTMPAFIAGDLFSDDFLDPHATRSTSGLSDLHTLTSLKQLAGRATVLNAGSLYHLFDEETQITLAKRLLSLLGESGLMIGGQVGTEEGGDHSAPSRMRPDRERRLFSPSKWIALWRSIDDSLVCHAELQDWKSVGRKRLVWSVRRR